MRVTVTRLVTHRCPYRDERDVGQITASWDGDSVELHLLSGYMDMWANDKITHELLTEKICHYIESTGATEVVVTTTWSTAGMTVEVTA